MGKRRDHHDLRRRPSQYDPRRRILVLCEGKLTEREYFEDLRQGNPLVKLRVHHEHSVPKPLVERAVVLKRESEREAKRQRDANLAYDEVWCVIDVDQHPNVGEAKRVAAARGILLAISNPCFELWALLHFQDQTAYIEGQKVKAKLRRHLPGYDKELPLDKLRVRYAEAVKRARALDLLCQQKAEVDGNPSTGVHRLVEEIRNSGERVSRANSAARRTVISTAGPATARAPRRRGR